MRIGISNLAVASGASAVLLFGLLARLAPEVRRGELLPYFDRYEVAESRLLGTTIYVDVSSGLSDLITVSALTAVSLGLALCSVLVRRRGGDQWVAFAAAAAGAAFLAADDLLAAHETLGHNLGFLAGVPAVDHPDDVIVGFYGLVVLAFAWRHRALAAGVPRWPWVASAAAGAFAVGHDLLPLHHALAEEGAEVLAGLALLTGVCMVAAGHLRSAAPVPRAGEAFGRPPA